MIDRIITLAEAIKVVVKDGRPHMAVALAEEIIMQCGNLRDAKDEVMKAACGERCYYRSICNNGEGLESYCNECELGNKLEELFG